MVSSSRDDHAPHWSPDGSRIAFASGRDGVQNIYTMAADGSDVVQLTFDTDPFETNAQPDYTADGRIVWVRSNALGLTTEIWEMDADGSDPQLLDSGFVDVEPSVSPLGEISFARVGDGTIMLMSADGSGVHAITDPVGADRSPAFAPDGRHVAFSRAVFEVVQLGPRHLFRERRNGSTLRQLTADPLRSDTVGGWSPDGDELVFSACAWPAGCADGDSQIYSIHSNGLGEQQLTTAGGSEPDWGPSPAP
jgi:TolB protein